MDANIINSTQSVNATRSESPIIPASALPVGATLKEYVITGIIGEGGFGIVYSARDTLLQRNVAIKEYMPAAIANRLASSTINLRSVRHQQTFDAGMRGFIDEARLLAQFKHPALVEILRFWEANSTAYMVMPHYSGKTLRNLLRQNRNQCSERWLKNIFAPILDATELLHNNNIYHRDIAPDNIVIQENGRPVLLDLGSARRVIAGMQSALTVVVKPGYAPIEQYTEDTINEQGPWTDIYALGAVLYFSITGSAPSASVSRMMRDTLKKLTTQDYPQFGETFLDAINCALELRPSDRFQSIIAFREALNVNAAFTSHSFLPPASNSTPQVVTDCGDDEITQILTAEEINQFKEKLLLTLSGTPPESQPFSENILLNNNSSNSTSISSFDDLKELIEKKPTIQKKSITDTVVDTPATTAYTITSSESATKKWPVVIPAIIASTLLITTLLVIYLITSTDDGVSSKEHSIANNQPVSTLKQQEAIPPYKQSNTAKSFDNPISSLTEESANTENTPPITTASIATENANDSIRNIDVKNDTGKVSFQTKPQPKSQPESINAAELGSAKVILVPWGEIWVDGKRYGVSPPIRELSLAPGSYHIELRNPGLPTEARTVTFTKGENPVIYHNFSASKPATANNNTANSPADSTQHNQAQQKTAVVPQTTQPKTAGNATEKTQPAVTNERTLNIKVLPWGEVILDGKVVGVTPPLHQLKLSPGDHTIEIRHPNYTSKTISITAADPAAVILEHHFK